MLKAVCLPENSSYAMSFLKQKVVCNIAVISHVRIYVFTCKTIENMNKCAQLSFWS